MTGLRDGLLARAEALLDRKITYSSMGPSIFGVLDIRNIRIYGTGTDPLVTIPRLRVSYSLPELLRGNPLESLRQIRLDRPQVSTDLERDADLAALFSAGAGEERGFTFSPEMLPPRFRVRVRGGEALINSRGNRFLLGGLNLDASIREGRISLQGRWSAGAALEGMPSWAHNLTMAGRISGELTGDLKNGNFTLRFPSLRGDEASLRPVAFNLALGEEKIELRKLNDRAPFDLALDYYFSSRRLSGEFRAVDFSPRDLFSFTGPRRDLNRWLNLKMNGAASFTWDGGEAVSYDLDLWGSLPPGQDPGPAAYVIRGAGNEEYARISRLSLGFDRGSLEFSGGVGLKPLAPNGTVSLKDMALSGGGELNGEIALSTEGPDINIFAENLSLGPVLLSALDALIIREAGGFTFSLTALRFTNIESYENVGRSSLSLAGSYDYSPRNLQLSLILDAFPAEDILNMARPFLPAPAVPSPALTALRDISVTTEIFVTTDFEHVLYNSPRFVVAYGGVRDVFATISVSGTDRRFELSEGRVAWAGGGAEASGYMDFSDPNDISFSFNASYRDMAYYLEGFILDQSLSLRGSYGLLADIKMTGAQNYSGYVEAAAIPVPMGEHFVRLSFQSFLRFESSTRWSVDIFQLDLADIPSPAAAASLALSGGADQDGAFIRDLVYDDGLGVLSGEGSLSWDPGEAVAAGSLALRDQEGTEVYELTGVLIRGEPDLRLRGTGMRVSRMLRNAYNAAATGELRLFRDEQGLTTLDMDLESLSARIGENDISGAARGSLNSRELLVSAVTLQYGGLRAELPLLRINREELRVRTSLRVWGTALGRDMDLSLTAAVEFAPIDSWLTLSQALTSFSGSLEVERARFDALETEELFSFTFSRDKEELALSGGPGDILRLRIAGDGTFYAGLSHPSPIRGSLIGTITPRTIDATASNLYVDLASLWRFVPTEDIINFTGGFVTASVRITGPLADPEFFGSAQGTSVRIEIPQYLNAEIGPVPMFISLEGNEMRFGPVKAPSGSGSALVEGWFRFDRWVPNIFSLDIRSFPEAPIPFGFDIMGILAHGLVSGNLNLAMADNNFRVTGTLTGHDAEITLDTQELSAHHLDQNERVTVATDITIVTGRKVEFLWPSADLPILRANADIGSELRINSDTLTGRYAVSGDISLRSGEIFYVQRSFYIREGILSFNENEMRFDPRISVRADIRDRTNDGPVTISMIVDSAPLKSFTARFESSPPLSQIDIVSLLGQNITGTSTAESGGGILQSALLASSNVLTQFWMVRWVEQRVRDFLGADMFSIRTQIIQIFVDNALTRFQDPIDRNGGVGNYFDNTTVFLGKYFGPDLFGQAMLSLRYDKNQPDWGGLSPELDLGLELRGPLFDIRWNFAPRHWENMFINDHSFTLIWRRSF
jgi:hypothetical protein